MCQVPMFHDSIDLLWNAKYNKQNICDYVVQF